MATTTALPLTNKISIEAEKSVVFREVSAQFGDGYKQVAPDGINNKIDNWNITWSPLSSTELTTVETVLNTNGSWGILSWTPAGESVAKNFRMSKEGYTRKALNRNGLFSISCKLVQVFDV